ncbi:MAG: M48 family metalloprotease [Phenylobacterium sp.]|uniref:M48 family metalloprotease n=1 Tax=Phenylobacterium sp. TaxID=1871053 RepID=UPI003BB7D777
MRALILAAVASLALGAPAQAQRLAGVRPDVTSDEGGLWAVSDKAESVARQSAELDRDPALNAYVREVACKVARDHCADIRVYVMDRPFFNASMAPNGYTEVWSGTLLRATDEAELAFILGHEVSHFDRNHSLLSWRRKKSTSNAMMVLSAGVAVVGVAAASSAATYDGASSIMDATRSLIDVVYLTGMASLFSYDRENELEADRLGLARVAQAGYAPAAAADVWRAQMGETSASEFKRVRNSGARTNVFASHPVDSERLKALQDDLKTLPATGEEGRARHRAAIRPHLSAWLRDDLRRRDFGQTLNLIGRLASGGEDLGVLNFYRGEAYRQRRGEGDLASARDAYLAAAAYPDAPVAVWRELGDLRRKESDTAGARTAYETYLAKAPSAEDAWIVQDSLNSFNSGN